MLFQRKMIPRDLLIIISIQLGFFASLFSSGISPASENIIAVISSVKMSLIFEEMQIKEKEVIADSLSEQLKKFASWHIELDKALGLVKKITNYDKLGGLSTLQLTTLYKNFSSVLDYKELKKPKGLRTLLNACEQIEKTLEKEKLVPFHRKIYLEYATALQKLMFIFKTTVHDIGASHISACDQIIDLCWYSPKEFLQRHPLLSLTIGGVIGSYLLYKAYWQYQHYKHLRQIRMIEGHIRIAGQDIQLTQYYSLQQRGTECGYHALFNAIIAQSQDYEQLYHQAHVHYDAVEHIVNTWKNSIRMHRGPGSDAELLAAEEIDFLMEEAQISLVREHFRTIGLPEDLIMPSSGGTDLLPSVIIMSREETLPEGRTDNDSAYVQESVTNSINYVGRNVNAVNTFKAQAGASVGAVVRAGQHWITIACRKDDGQPKIIVADSKNWSLADLQAYRNLITSIATGCFDPAVASQLSESMLQEAARAAVRQ